ncbi:MAG: DOMON-like domain-containing protein [Pseudomonadota bacterium]
MTTRSAVLVPFPGKPHPKIQVSVEAARLEPGRLRLWYIVTGAVQGLKIPSHATPARVDGLWHHSCCEAFVRSGSGTAYREVNLSPSSQWAAYDFESYRKGGANAAMPVPVISISEVPGKRFALGADLHFDSAAMARAPWHLGLSMVVEEKDGGKSWWALAHSADKPDFHRADCFTLELPAANAA